MKRMLLLSMGAFAAVAHAQDVGGVDWALRYRLVHATQAEDLAHLYDDADLNSGTPRTGDLLAEYLLRVADDPRLDGHEGAGMVAALGKRAGSRWRAAMQKLRESEAPVLLRAAAFEYVTRHPAAGDEYAPGSIDVEALRDADAKAALAIQPTQLRATTLGALEHALTPSQVLAKIGPPQAVRLAQVSNFRRMLWYYRGAGRVVFGSLKTEEWRQQSTVVDALLFEDEMPYRDEPAKYGQPDDATLRMIQVASGRPYPVRMGFAGSYAAPSVEMLDIAAEWLLQNAAHVDDRNEDSLAWAARLLRERGGVRYAALLKQITHDIDSAKVRRYSKLTPHRAKNVPATPYVLGTVSLPDVARKYALLYPDVTFTSGQL